MKALSGSIQDVFFLQFSEEMKIFKIGQCQSQGIYQKKDKKRKDVKDNERKKGCVQLI